ncbi:hypothetical protein BTA51_02070 [Hahella sp. CCB-MM4]|uniref:DUF58 domain-containing protein n=1 Tax=Hahella sp. (strain CCB-MM4) TaxID=1926491 RepID=UPI000B9AF24C|nr:DUF58 domain-containing protein [Hahella sp. CCB-MM4]OZG75194.1 hypothetical protein BTA51_02070 [Hahella sp. CCB-MM4]
MTQKVQPSPRLLQLLILLLLLSAGWQGWLVWQKVSNPEATAGFSDGAVSLLIAAGAILGLVLLGDLVLSWRLTSLSASRRLTHNLALERWVTVGLRLSSSYPRPLKVRVFDMVPEDCEYRQLPETIELLPGRETELSYDLRPRRRGPLLITQYAVQVSSVLGLWRLSAKPELVSESKVYPDFASLTGLQLLAIDHQTSQLGIKRKPRRGTGLDFHQLREYRQGDSLRQIDWKATSRRHRLISREYQDERDQQVILMLDGGRRMLTQEGYTTHFDHCLNCLLMLSHVALRQGDAVAMMSFGSELRHIAPVKGTVNINRILNQFYDLYPDKSAPDYLQAAQELMLRYRKRSLVVLTTNLREEDTDDLIAACRLLKKRHLVLLANLRESSLDRVMGQPVDHFDQALRFAGVVDYMAERERLQKLLRAEGLFLIDSTPDHLTPEVINSYYAIKGAGYL